MDCLYHYCSNEKCFSILNSKTLRLSDIQKSNDYREMTLFFPGLLYAIEDAYKASPFSFKYKNLEEGAAFFELSRDAYDYWNMCFNSGAYSNFVVCFCEAKDSLSQWRGYADNGKGCAIGFSKKLLQEYCDRNKDVLQMVEVEYLSNEQINEKIKESAQECLNKLQSLRNMNIEMFSKYNDESMIDILIKFQYSGIIEDVLVNTLRYKSIAFIEEKEWRIFFKKAISKSYEWLNGEQRTVTPLLEQFHATERFLKDKVRFRITDDDIIPFCPIEFSEFSENPVLELWRGPKNRIQTMDIKLYLQQNGYNSTRTYQSHITYC